MNAPVWRVEDDGEVLLPGSPMTAEAGLVSLPFLIAAVRRKWRLVAVTGRRVRLPGARAVADGSRPAHG